MTDEWDEYAPGWDDDEAARTYAAAAHASLLELLARVGRGLDGARILDFGCGTGLLTERLAPTCVTIDAVDTSRAMLDVLDTKIVRHGWSHVTTATSLPTPSGGATGEYDLVVCSSVCSFLDDYPGTLVQLVALLAPGGVFVQWDWERDDADDDPHGLTRAEISDALTAAGLTTTIVETAFEVAFGDMTMRPLIGSGLAPLR